MKVFLRLALQAPAVIALALALAAFAPTPAEAANVKFFGEVGYSHTDNSAVLAAVQVKNFDAGGTSANLKMELWAYPATFTGASQAGYKLAEAALGPLAGSDVINNVNSGTIAFVYPPNGSWHVAMLLTEFTGAALDDGYSTRDWFNFANLLAVGSQPPALTPYIGSWWNPSESGSGYALDYRHGVLVVTTYSYLAGGAAQWYISAGPLSGTTFTATLDKAVNGQCISCPYRASSVSGNDGTITIIFSSPTSATIYLPGGRVNQIVPLEF